MKNFRYIIMMVVAATALYSCNDGDLKISGGTPPGQVTNVTFTPLNGGGFFLYTIPSNADFLYARAEYTLDNGQTISKSSSVYSDTLFIEGLGTVKEYEVKLFSVNRTGGQSAPLLQKVTPLVPTTAAVLQTVKVQPGFSALVIDWQNPLQETITVLAIVTVGGKEVTLAHSSNTVIDRFTIPNLAGVPHQVKVRIRDIYGNETEAKDFGDNTPYIDGAISKKQWSFLRNNLMYGDKWDYSSAADPQFQTPLPDYKGSFRDDSLKNARETFQEGRVEKFWDNVYDYNPVQNLNYFHTGTQSYPFSYFIDMGRRIVASRLKIWQRDSWGQLYTAENVRTFEIWISDDPNPKDGVLTDWEYVGRYRIVRPDGTSLEALNAARNGHEFMLYPDNPRFTRPFRYLRFKAIDQAGNPISGNSACSSELTLFGTEADGSIINDPATLTGVIPGWEN